MKIDIRKCDKCGIQKQFAAIAHGTLHHPLCWCGGAMTPVPLTDSDVTRAETAAATRERERCLKIVTTCFGASSGLPHVEACLKAIREGAEPESLLGKEFDRE